MTGQNEIFIVYEAGQIDEARGYAENGAIVVCLDFWVERELKKQKIPHVSLRDIVDSETGEEEWWLLAQKIAREWYRLPAMQFFEYRNIRIGEVIEPIMEEYLSRLFYYVRIYAALKKMYPHARLSIPVFNVENEPEDVCLFSIELRVVSDAARMAGFTVAVIDTAPIQRSRPHITIRLKSLLLRLYNKVIHSVPRHRLKIYVGEYWSHFAPIIEQMNDTELILAESGALAHIPWRQLLARRVRVRHTDDEIRNTDRKRAEQFSRNFVKQWATARKDVMEYLVCARGELDWGPVLEACEYLMTHAKKVVADIDAIHRIMDEEKPDVILQSASVAGRHHHFFIAARVAAEFNVPSIELQHGINTIDPRTVFSRVETDFLATYGTYTSSWYERMGYARDRLFAIGSPRFDKNISEHANAQEKGKQLLKKLGLDTERPVLLVAVPLTDQNPATLDSYQLADFFETIRAVQKAIPGVQVLFKFRHDKHIGAMREYFQTLFPYRSAVTGHEDLFALLCASDVVVSGNSTIIYQTMLAQKPLMLYPWKSLDTYNAQVVSPAAPLAYASKEAVDTIVRIFSDMRYREELLARQKKFLEKYSFDGRASERMIELIRQVARK